MAIDPKELNTDGLIFETEDDAAAPLRATMEQSIKQNPEQSAKIFDISQKAKTDTELVRSNPEDFERAQALKGLNLDGLVLSSPGTAKYLEDVDNASVSHDDVPVLKRLETAIKNAFSYTPLGLSAQAGQATGEFVRDTYDDGKVFEGLGTTIPNSFKDVGAGFEQLRMNTRERELTNQKAIADNTPPWLKYIAGEEVDDANREAVTERVSVEQEALIEQFSESLNAVRTRAIENMEATPENLTITQEGVRAGITSGSHMAAALTAAALTRSGRAGVLTLMGGSTYGSSYAEAMQKGLSDDDAHMYSLIQASIEVGTEMLPTKTLLALASTPAGGKMFKGVVKFMVQEGYTEQIATLGQTLTDYGYGLDEELANAKSAEEALEIQARRQAVTAIATVVGGGGQIGVAKAASKLGEQLMTEEQRNQMKQEYEQAQLDEIAKVAAESKTKKRSPAMMKRFMQSATDTESNEIHIDAVQARLYISSLDADVVAADPALQLLAERIQTNDAPNGDITIPLGDFAADIVGNEHYEALRPHMKLSGETDTPFRREAEGQQRVEYAKNLMMQAEQNASAYVENRQMFESVKQQLIDTEVVSPKLADYYAQLIPAYVTVKADELGKSPLEVYEELGLRIEGPYAERKAALAEGRVLEQQPANSGAFNPNDPNTLRQDGFLADDTRMNNFKKWFGNSAVTDENDSPKVVYHGTTADFDTFQKAKAGVNTQADNAGEGFFFTDQPGIAGIYPKMQDGQGDNIMPTYLSIQKPLTLNVSNMTEADQMITAHFNDNFDGVIINVVSGNQTVYMVRDANQIKSAVGNNGNFDPSSANILKQDDVDMSKDARMARAKEQGFDVDTVYYHGTGANFDSFKEGYGGVYFSESADYADRYTTRNGETGRNIIPVYLKLENTFDTRTPEHRKIYEDKFLMKYGNGTPLREDGLPDWVEAGDFQEFFEQEGLPFDSAIVGEPPTTLDDNTFKPEQSILVTNEKNIRSINAAFIDENSTQILSQTQARGYYDVSNVTIRLTEASDASTFLHEFAHFMLDMERKTGGRQMGNISLWWSKNREEIAREASLEVEVVDRWIEDETTVEPVQAEALDRATHEQFARGFETYIMEGKAPSIELRNAFRVFARLIRQVYNTIRNGLNSPNLDAEMRQVFDRLLATEEQIVAEEARSRYEPLFTDAAMAGMTDEAYESYIERSENARDKARETLRDKLLRELTRNTKAWWKQELEDRKEDKLVELANEPVYAAREAIANDDAFKIDRVAAKELLGVDKIPPTLRGMTITGKRGGMPDDVAATLGYNSGQELLDALMTAPPINQAAQEAAEAEMLKVHGDIMNDGSLEQMAQDAARNEERADLILEEVKQLSRATTIPQIDKQTLKFLAAQQIGKRSLTQIRPDKYRRAEIRSAQEATVAMQNNDKEAALRAKTQQVMNMYLWQSAMAAREQGERVTKHMARFRKKSVRERIGKAGNGYLEAIMGILDRFEFRKSISIRKAQENAQSIQAWLTERMQDGDNIVLTAEVVDERYGMHWKQLPIDELTGIYESVLSIEHNAKTANEIMLAEEKVTFEQSIQRALASMAKVKNKYSAQRTDIIDEKNPVRRFIAEQTKIPFLTTWLDGGERAGVVNDLIMTPINNAQHQEQELWATVGRSVVDALQNRSKEMRKRHAKKIHIPELVSEPTEMHTGHDGNLYGHQIIAVALNTGNESNLRKMLVGEGWATEENVSFNNPQLQAALSHMTKEDWDLVQDIWTNIDVLYPMLADVHERTSGLALPKVEATPVQTPFGEYSGGYYPAKYDPNRSQRAADNEEKANEQTLSMFNGAGLLLPTVSTGARQERTGYTGPIKLSLEVVQEHMHEVIHFVTHYEAVKQVDKFIRDPRIAEAVKAKMGKEEYNLLRPWLNDVAKDGRGSESKLQMESWLGKLRVGVTLGTMGFKASTILIQGSGIFNTMAETGTVNVLRAMRSIMASDKTMGEAYNHAFEHSKVLKYRMQTMDRELRNVLSSVEGKNSMWAKTQQTSMMGIALFQTYTVDVASWYAGYIKGMKDFEGDQLRAYKYADWVVENAQGSGNTKDMAAIMRNKNEGWRLFTMFMTFFSSLGNMTRDTVRGARSGQYSIGSVGAKAILMFLMPALYETLMREGVPDDDDELEDFVERVTFNAVMMPVGSQPVIRDAANGLGSGFGYNSSPVTATIGKGVQASASMTKKLAEDDEVTVPQIKNFSKLIAAWYGVPGTNQMWATGEHIGEVLNDGEDFSTRELLFGPDRE